jgi:hypothetical protein
VSELTPGERLRIAEQMHLEGLEMKRQQLRRANPAADELAIEELLQEWLADRPPDVSPARIRQWP